MLCFYLQVSDLPYEECRQAFLLNDHPSLLDSLYQRLKACLIEKDILEYYFGMIRRHANMKLPAYCESPATFNAFWTPFRKLAAAVYRTSILSHIAETNIHKQGRERDYKECLCVLQLPLYINNQTILGRHRPWRYNCCGSGPVRVEPFEAIVYHGSVDVCPTHTIPYCPLMAA